jgi:carboxyl-terminal processing protease
MPDVVIEQELPVDLKPKRAEKPRGEASLRGHLRGEDAKKNQKEESGSSAYVPKEPEKDQQLQYALKLLRGEIAEPTTSAKEEDDKADAAKPDAAEKKESTPAPSTK